MPKCRQCRWCRRFFILKIKRTVAMQSTPLHTKPLGCLRGPTPPTPSSLSPVSPCISLVCFSGDLFVGSAGSKITSTCISNNAEMGLRAFSNPSGITLGICWSFMCHPVTYFRQFRACFFEAFSILERQDYG